MVAAIINNSMDNIHNENVHRAANDPLDMVIIKVRLQRQHRINRHSHRKVLRNHWMANYRQIRRWGQSQRQQQHHQHVSGKSRKRRSKSTTSMWQSIWWVKLCKTEFRCESKKKLFFFFLSQRRRRKNTETKHKQITDCSQFICRLKTIFQASHWIFMSQNKLVSSGHWDEKERKQKRKNEWMIKKKKQTSQYTWATYSILLRFDFERKIPINCSLA